MARLFPRSLSCAQMLRRQLQTVNKQCRVYVDILVLGEKTVIKVVKGAEDPEAFTVRILAASPLVSDKSETQYLKSRRGC